MSNKDSFFVKYPIWQIIYCTLWGPFGAIVSFILANALLKMVTLFTMRIVGYFLYDAINLYVISGRMQLTMNTYNTLILVCFDLIFLIVGLEWISSIVNKKAN